MAPPDTSLAESSSSLKASLMEGTSSLEPPFTPKLVGNTAGATASSSAVGLADDDGGLWLSITSYARLLFGASVMGLGVIAFLIPLTLALPSRPLRIRISNVFGSIFGRFMFACSSSSWSQEGYEEAVARGPAIWAMNHTSLLDIPVGIWFAPSGSVGVGKRQVIYYPFFGILYVLAGHLRIDRRQTKSAVAGMQKMAKWVRDEKLSIFIWPEGTRSRDGRLTAMKKGVAHLAIQTGLPIQPMATAGMQKVWPKGPPKVRPGHVHIVFPEPIDTTGWKHETIDEHLAELEEAFIDALPPEQRPLHALR